MGLYDGYRLANSNQVKQYQGSAVPEMVAVNNEMQNRYDKSQDQMDYVGRFMNSMQALPGDQAALQDVSNQYKGKLDSLSQRKDLENAVRETSILARDLPQDYAPFAARISARKTYQDDLQKMYEKGDIRSRETLDKLMKHSDNTNTIQKDPMTGKYKGTYSGYNPAKEIDKNKFVDDAMQHVAPQVLGFKTTNVNGEWLADVGDKTRKLSPAEIDKVMNSAYANSEDWQSYMKQEKMLNTSGQDYSKVTPDMFNLNQAIGQKLVPGTGKNQSAKLMPVTLQDTIKEKMSQGVSFGEAVKDIQQGLIQRKHEQEGRDYAHKYAINDRETENTLRTNDNFWKENEEKKKTPLQVATTMTLGGGDEVKDVGDFKDVKSKVKDGIDASAADYANWIKGKTDGKVKYDLGGGRIGYKGPDGKMVDVTEDANAFRGSINYAKQKHDQLTAIDEAAMREAHFDPTKIPASVKADADKVYKDITTQFTTGANSKKILKSHGTKSGEVIDESRPYTAAEIRDKAERARQDYLKLHENEAPGYSAYKDALTRRMKGTTVGSDLFTFRDESTVENLSKNVEGLVSGLGVKNGVVPVQDKNGKQLSAGDWDDLKGHMRAIGVTYTGDPQSPVALVMRGFKEVKGKSTSGEDMIVKLPNTNIQSIIGENMNQAQKDYLQRSSGLAASLNNAARSFSTNGVSIKPNSEDARGGWTVKVGSKEATLYNFKDILNFMDKNHK